MKWGSPNYLLKQLPPVLFGTWGGLGILPPQQPPTITSPLVKAGRVPLTGITEGATLPTKVAVWPEQIILYIYIYIYYIFFYIYYFYLFINIWYIYLYFITKLYFVHIQRTNYDIKMRSLFKRKSNYFVPALSLRYHMVLPIISITEWNI